MPGEAEHGKQFARDLCSIRRAREVSLTDIHEATRMAYDLIKRFEHDALIDHPQFNRVYIRLFVRGYATRIGIDSGRALEAFELAMKGKYDGLLAREYLETSGEAPSDKEPEPEGGGEAPETPEPEDAASAETGQKSPAKTRSAPPAEADPKPPAKAAPKPPGEAKPAPPAKVASKPSSKADPGSPAEAESALPASEPSEKSKESVAMALPPEAPPKPLAKEPAVPAASPTRGVSVAAPAMPAPSKSSGSVAAGRQAPAASEGRLDPRWIFVGLLVVVITLVVWNLARAMSAPDEANEPPPSSAAPPASVHATVEANEASEALGAPGALEAPGASGALGLPLPDTLAITVAADKGSVAPIRVTLDEDVRRPYWIKRGDTMTFRMGSRIILEQQLDSVTVHVEGMAYPLSMPAGQDSVILTHAALESWHSSLSR